MCAWSTPGMTGSACGGVGDLGGTTGAAGAGAGAAEAGVGGAGLGWAPGGSGNRDWYLASLLGSGSQSRPLRDEEGGLY